MGLAIVNSRAASGVGAPAVTVEVHLRPGMPSLSIVGLPQTVVKESKDRVRCALVNCHFEFPVKRIIVNLAPADLPKEGGRFDLAIAIGILVASGQLKCDDLSQYEFGGELALSGDLRSIRGALPMAIGTQKENRCLIIPEQNASEAGLADALTLYPAKNLVDVVKHLSGQQALVKYKNEKRAHKQKKFPDMQDIVGQEYAKRALEIAAAGEHSILFYGSPGAGKTMLASRLPGILPDMRAEEALSVAALYSITANGFDYSDWACRPFRAPHHTASAVALVGGGNPPRPGEISLAHQGVLFLDELPEFSRSVLEVLREPLETHEVTISRASHHLKFPANFQLIAAMNPCPCGYLNDEMHDCHCTAEQVMRYRHRLSGPLLDRIDMHVEVSALPKNIFFSKALKNKSESSAVFRARVIAAREKQYARANESNAQLSGQKLNRYCQLGESETAFLEGAATQLGLSMRAIHRVLKLGRTIADLYDAPIIMQKHLEEALSFRELPKNIPTIA